MTMSKSLMLAAALAGVTVLVISDGDNRSNDELVRQLASRDREDLRDCDLGRGLGRLARMRIVEEVPALASPFDWLDSDSFLFREDRKRLNELAFDTTRILMSCSHKGRPTVPASHHRCSRLRVHDCGKT